MKPDPEDPNEEPLPPEVQAKAEALVKRFFAECFWFRHPEATIRTAGDARLVVKHLRDQGGRDGWREASDLLRCL